MSIGKDCELKEETIEAVFDISRRDSEQEIRQSAQNTLNKVERKLLPVERSEIIRRDGDACLCCGERNYLQIDHIKPKWIKIDNSYENLQTLCKFCNGLKGTKTINFLENETKLHIKPSEPPSFKDIYYMDRLSDVTNLELWKKILKRQINFFLSVQCSGFREHR
nr:HNH endonuclease [Methanobacterium formicicum]